MTDISYYEVNVKFSTGKPMSEETNNTRVTFLIEYEEEMSNANSTLQSESFDYTITIVVYNSEGMSSQPTSKSFGMKIHTQLYIYITDYI